MRLGFIVRKEKRERKRVGVVVEILEIANMHRWYYNIIALCSLYLY